MVSDLQIKPKVLYDKVLQCYGGVSPCHVQGGCFLFFFVGAVGWLSTDCISDIVSNLKFNLNLLKIIATFMQPSPSLVVNVAVPRLQNRQKGWVEFVLL